MCTRTIIITICHTAIPAVSQRRRTNGGKTRKNGVGGGDSGDVRTSCFYRRVVGRDTRYRVYITPSESLFNNYFTITDIFTTAVANGVDARRTQHTTTSHARP